MASHKVSFIRNICCTCLSLDRKLFPVEDLVKLPALCCNTQCTQLQLLEEGMVCWECRAVVMKMASFIRQAHLAKKLLKDIYKPTKELIETPVATLSKLAQINLSTICCGLEEMVSPPLPFFLEISSNECQNHKDIVKTEPDLDIRHNFDVDVLAEEYIKTETPESTEIENESNKITSIPSHEPKSDKLDIGPDFDVDVVNKGYIKTETPESTEIEKVSTKITFFPSHEPKPDKLVEEVELKETTSKEVKTNLNVGEVIKQQRDGKLCDLYKIVEITETQLTQIRDLKCGKTKACRYKCDTCLETFKQKSMLDDHNMLKHKECHSFVCSVCQQRFLLKESLEDHAPKHFRCFECCICGFRNDTSKSMDYHHRVHHNRIERECCGQHFTTYSSYRNHRRTHTKHPCPECPEVLSSKTSLTIHAKLRHQTQEMVECKICHKTLSKSSISGHLRRHSVKDEPQYCHVCDRFYKSNRSYNIHFKISSKHTQSNPKFECDYCTLKFSNKIILTSHIVRDHLKLSYPCPTCNKKLSCPNGLKSHMGKYHRGKKAVKTKRICETCGKAFTTSGSLNLHMATHTDERPHPCQHCKWRFKQKSTLVTHMWLKHKINLRKSTRSSAD